MSVAVARARAASADHAANRPARLIALAVMVVAAIGALAVQNGLPGLRGVDDVPRKWGAAALAGAIAWWLSGRALGPSAFVLPKASATDRRTRAMIALGVPSALVCASGDWLLKGDLTSALGGWLWLVGVVGLFAAALAYELPAPGLAWLRVDWREWAWRSLVVAVVLASLAIRLYKLEAIPADLNNDEAEFAEAGLNLWYDQPPLGEHVATQVSVFQTGWAENPYGGWFIQALSMEVVGETVFGLRLPSAICGALGVWLFYLLLREMAPRWAALAGAVLLSIGHTHLFWTRVGLVQSMMLLCTTGVFLGMLRGYRTRRFLPWVVAGVWLGAAQYVYLGARFLVPIVVLFLAYLALRDRAFVRQQWAAVASMAAASVVLFLPQGFWLAAHPELLTGPGGRTFIFNKPEYLNEFFPGQGVVGIVIGQLRRCLTSLAFTGDGSQAFYPPHVAIVDPVVGALFLLGLVGVSFGLRRPGYALISIWFWVSIVLLGIPTIDTPSMSRMVVVLPAIVAIAAIALDRLAWVIGRVGGRAALAPLALPLCAALAYAALWNYKIFFVDYPVDSPAKHATVAARIVRDLGPTYKSYVVTPPGMWFNVGIMRFIARGMAGDDVSSIDEIPVKERGYRNANFIIFPWVKGAVEKITRTYPGHQLFEYRTPKGELLFYTYQVPAAQFAEQAGPDAVWRQWDFKFGQKGSKFGQFDTGAALAIDASGRVYLADRGNGRIDVFDPKGRPLAMLGAPGVGDGQFKNIADVAVAPDGTVLGLDRETRWIQRFDPSGKWLAKLGGPDVLKAPDAMAVGPDGVVVVSDTAQNVLVRMTLDGQPVEKVGAQGKGPGQLERPGAVAVGPDGTVYVADLGNKRIERFARGREFAGEWPMPPATSEAPPRMTVAQGDGGALYVSSPAGGQVYRYLPDGKLDFVLGKHGDGPVELIQPTALAASPAGDLYLLDYVRHQIFVYDLSRRLR